MSRVVCFGELLLRMSAPGRELLLQHPQLAVHAGGAEANVGVSLAHLGHAVAVVSTVPANPLGEYAVGELRRHGVDTTAVRRTEGRMGLYFLTTGAVQRASEVVYDRADSAFANSSAADYDWDTLLAGADWLHLSGVSPALNPAMAQATLAAARAACARGVKVSFDGNFRPSLWARWQGDAPGILRELFACADLVFADYRDIGVVLGGDFKQGDVRERVDAAAAQAFAAFPRLQWMACTQRTPHSVDNHALGAMLVGRDGTRAVAPTREMLGIVDRIGGGDAFAAGILHGMMRGFAPDAIVRFGLAAGCLKHSIPGDFNPVSEADIMALTGEERFDVRR
ncbi:2-keto-3-deoxygluconate kinase [Stenotrophomonas maltophilia]|jgi:2-dehydro-3-deoxygluconokinase|uniref:2-keto-3-deoxygluconate kinase n=1 Tax=Stenotrophomonas maltophilia TaxID=40324 RepID=A0A246HIV0_STEMA|nr:MULTISPECIES: sugar kinase [Stenotrophomonas]MBW8375450.1 sugar kinase [Stenotrophomonas sp.]OWQ49562.1 2-keto-3-deoxygluconate kinase [Stenotrophomonas maltophilia]HAV73112.1 sugar kinase [Stenotrophomonas sp.]